jgi:hypothetical protein
MSLSRWKSLPSAISRSARRWWERANHRATVKRAPVMSLQTAASKETGRLERYRGRTTCGQLGWTWQGSETWCRVGPRPDRTEPDQ